MYPGNPSLTCIAAWPSGKWSAREGRELHRVLEQTRAGRETRVPAGRPPADSADEWRREPSYSPCQACWAIMKNWLPTANFMYRHVFVKSFASSASLVVVRIVLGESVQNSATRPAAAASSAPMICGSERSSSRAWPSAIRSGQKATSTSRRARRDAARRTPVVPG